MRKIVLTIFLSGILTSLFGQGGEPRVRFGLTTSPAISWLKGADKNVDGGKVRMGFEYGLLLDINLSKKHQNYMISTGITGILNGGNAVYDSLVVNKSPLVYGSGVHARYKMQYLNIPVSLKLKTNEIGYITYYGQIGFVPAFRVGARVDSEQLLYENAKLGKDNETIFKAPLFQLGLNVGAGIEYSLNDRTALLVGLNFVNNFTNGVKVQTEDKDKQAFKYVLLRVGILF